MTEEVAPDPKCTRMVDVPYGEPLTTGAVKTLNTLLVACGQAPDASTEPSIETEVSLAAKLAALGIHSDMSGPARMHLFILFGIVNFFDAPLLLNVLARFLADRAMDNWHWFDCVKSDGGPRLQAPITLCVACGAAPATGTCANCSAATPVCSARCLEAVHVQCASLGFFPGSEDGKACDKHENYLFPVKMKDAKPFGFNADERAAIMRAYPIPKWIRAWRNAYGYTADQRLATAFVSPFLDQMGADRGDYQRKDDLIKMMRLFEGRESYKVSLRGLAVDNPARATRDLVILVTADGLLTRYQTEAVNLVVYLSVRANIMATLIELGGPLDTWSEKMIYDTLLTAAAADKFFPGSDTNSVLIGKQLLALEAARPNRDSNIILKEACRHGNIEFVRLLLQDTRPLGRADPGEWPAFALLHAVETGNVELVRLLVADARTSVADMVSLEKALKGGPPEMTHIIKSDPRFA